MMEAIVPAWPSMELVQTNQTVNIMSVVMDFGLYLA